jgi:hypothetical protein
MVSTSSPGGTGADHAGGSSTVPRSMSSSTARRLAALPALRSAAGADEPVSGRKNAVGNSPAGDGGEADVGFAPGIKPGPSTGDGVRGGCSSAGASAT